MSLTVSEIDVPMSAVSASGSTRASARARRSRRTCVRSFRAWAKIRRTAAIRSGGGRARLAPAALDQRDEHVLQRVVLLRRLEHAYPRLLEAPHEPRALSRR